MKTISFKFKCNEDVRQILDEQARIYSSMVRYSFNRYKDGKSYKEIYNILGTVFPNMSSHLRNCSARQASTIYLLNKDKKVHFGKFKRFQKGLITKDEYKDSKNLGIYSEGECPYKGNRFFQLDVQNNKVIYKKSRHEHFELNLTEHLSNKRKNLLLKIQSLMNEKKIPVSVKVKNDNIYFTYDEKVVEKEKQFKNLMNNRVLGIDLNPNYFGISIIEFKEDDSFKVIHKEVIDLEELQSKRKNKIHFELYEINHHISNLCNRFHASKLSVEDLKFKKNNKFWSKSLNRLCKNQFRYSIVKSHLNTLCSTYGVELIEVNAAYSSIIGNFVHGGDNTPDMVAASIEIARRSYRKFEKGWFQPKFVENERLKQVLGNQWKEELGQGYQSWKGLSGKIKESKLKYRFQLNPLNAVFRKRNRKSYVEFLTFFNKI